MSTPDVLVAGETLVDFLPDRSGPLASVERFDRRAGGAPANVAVGLARLGEPPWFLSNVSTDAFGDFLVSTLDDYGVPDRFLTRDADHATTLAFVSHDEHADREFSFYRADGADRYLDAEAVPDDALAAVSWVCVGGVALSAEPARSATFELVERAHEQGCQVVFDPNSRPELWTDDATFADVTERMVARADVAKFSPADLDGTGLVPDDPRSGGVGEPGGDEASVDATDDDEALARAVLDAGPHTAFVTRGARGASVRADAEAPWGPIAAGHPGYDAASTDTTGAGDAFLAGALAALADGAPPAEVLAFAGAVAALTTTGTGAMAALPDRAAVAAFRERHRS